MRHRLELDVSHPDEFWFVTAADGFVTEDPDIEDGRTRTYDKGHADWALIGAMLSDISRQLLGATEDEIEISFELPDSPADLDVILAWFSVADQVLGDPGSSITAAIGCGRHGSPPPDAVLPVRSAIRSLDGEVGTEASEIAMVVEHATDELWARNEGQRAWFTIRQHASSD